MIRRAQTRTREAFDRAVAHAINQVRQADIIGCVSYAAYRLI